MFQLGIQCDHCSSKVTVSLNTVFITESGNELPARKNICPDCLMWLFIELDLDEPRQQKPTLTRIK